MQHAFDIPRIVIAGASSNVGKTTITAGLIAALRQRGLTVQPFKCGPDYVDPSYHERAAGRPCRNLDTWMLSDSQLLDSFARACLDADIAVVEGVMGLYDGSDWHDERGSTAQIAKLLNAPVLLVFDISGSARSAAAGVLGYKTFDPAVAIRGVVLNFAGSEGHALGCAGAIQGATSLSMLGWLPREMRLQIPERHLGLVPGGEQVDSDALIAQMATAVAERFDLDGIVTMARAAVAAATAIGAGRSADVVARYQPPMSGRSSAAPAGQPASKSAPQESNTERSEHSSHISDAMCSRAFSLSAARASLPVPASRGAPAVAGLSAANAESDPVRVHTGHDADARSSVSEPRGLRPAARPILAVARDEAFCFYYPENLELLADEGAEMEFFSPLRGERPSPQAAGVYLGGGYPELHGKALSSNIALWQALKEMHAADKPIYAECGGFMVLTQGLTDSDGHTWPMAGLLPGITRMNGKLAALGYRYATATNANLLARTGESLKCHEFRYSSWVNDSNAAAAWNTAPAWEVTAARGKAPEDGAGYAQGNLLASYLHVHFGQRPELAQRFVARLR